MNKEQIKKRAYEITLENQEIGKRCAVIERLKELGVDTKADAVEFESLLNRTQVLLRESNKLALQYIELQQIAS